MRAAIYARYSSDLQHSRSIDDQVRVCRERAEREGWQIVDIFADYAISGAVRDRPALNAMLARLGDVDIVLTEALDRLSRSQRDVAEIFERIRFADVRLITLAEQEISELHIGLTGTMNALFRKSLGEKVKRGQRGRIEAGRLFGGRPYGYRKVARLDANGEPELGLTEIDPDEAEIVRRIYAEFLAGLSPRAIAQRLNAEGVPSPAGGLWRVSSINGDRIRQNGILQNELYAGRYVYGRTRMERHPVTRKRVPKLNPREEWRTIDMPELRIVDDATWQAVRERRERYEGHGPRRHVRPKKLLSGLARCGVCGGSVIVVGNEKWGCSAARDARACTNRNLVTTAVLERRVLATLQEQLLSPESVALYVREYHLGMAREQKESAARRAKLERKLAEVEGRIGRLAEAIAAGGREFVEIRDLMSRARADRDALAEEIANIEALPVVALHPNIAEDYRRNVRALAQAVADPDMQLEAVPAIRALIESVTLTPAREGRGCDIKVAGRLEQLIALATGRPVRSGDVPEGTVKMVAAGRLELPTSGL